MVVWSLGFPCSENGPNAQRLFPESYVCLMGHYPLAILTDSMVNPSHIPRTSQTVSGESVHLW
jgi:hypothetical protein